MQQATLIYINLNDMNHNSLQNINLYLIHLTMGESNEAECLTYVGDIEQ